jgi:hypothetical protein
MIAGMKKIFPLTAPGKANERVVESVKNDLRKYVKRERRKPLPEGFTQWDFACKTGPNRDTAVPCPLAAVGAAVDAIVRAGGSEVYVEILAVPGHRSPPKQGVDPETLP